MALVGNGVRLAGNPGTYRGASAFGVHRHMVGNKGGGNLNFWAGEGASSKVDGRPRGYRHPASWSMAPKPGGMASYGLMRGVATAAANLAGGRNGEAALSGSAAVDVDGSAAGVIASSLAGSSGITAGIGALGVIAAALSASGSVTDAAANLSAQAVATLSGSGGITNAALSLVVGAAATLAGSASLAAGITGGIGASAALGGSGGLLDAAAIGAGAVVAALGGAGAISAADARALGNLMAALAGTGAISAADARALAWMSADVTPFTELSPQGLANAVWSAIAASSDVPGSMGEKLNDAGSASNPWTEVIEGGYTAEQVLRLIVAALAGEVSGAGTTVITIKGLDGSTDRIVATVTPEGDRTALTLDAD